MPLHDETHRLLGTAGDPRQTLTATGSGTWRFVGKNKAYRAQMRIGGAVSGTNPTLDMRVQQAATSGGVATTVATFTQATASQVGYTTSGGTPRYEVPGTQDPPEQIFAATQDWIRVDYTVGGSASPSFGNVSVELVMVPGFSNVRSGT
jgi:hypothetical protein